MPMEREQPRSADAAVTELAERWQAACKLAAKRRRKLLAAQAKHDHVAALLEEADAAEESAFRELILESATTVDGLLAKARVLIAFDAERPGVLVEQVKRMVQNNDPGDGALVWSIARDLVAMLPPEARR